MQYTTGYRGTLIQPEILQSPRGPDGCAVLRSNVKLNFILVLIDTSEIPPRQNETMTIVPIIVPISSVVLNVVLIVSIVIACIVKARKRGEYSVIHVLLFSIYIRTIRIFTQQTD